jgi:hypothetical protein
MIRCTGVSGSEALDCYTTLLQPHDDAFLSEEVGILHRVQVRVEELKLTAH